MKRLAFTVCSMLTIFGLFQLATRGDGKVVPPRDYKGSLEETAQEAIIIFHSGDQPGKAEEDLILKIRVEGTAENFAWIVPFPSEPKVSKESDALFQELFDYVELRQQYSGSDSKSEGAAESETPLNEAQKVDVLSRKIVGEFDVAIVREKEAGGLNPWLEKEGFQQLEDAEDVLKFYRDQDYVFACIKVSSEALAKEKSVESHPLRFTFKTGGRDGVFFPMKLTGLQSQPFDVNLYVFYSAWLNDKLSPFGYQHRGFQLRYRDWDSPKCKANAGKAWSLPDEDPFLKSQARRLGEVKKVFQKLHPGEKYYLTNIQATKLDPADVRQWNGDLWLFPYYTNRKMVPYDAREGGPAAGVYPNLSLNEEEATSQLASAKTGFLVLTPIAIVLAMAVLAGLGGVIYWVAFRSRSYPDYPEPPAYGQQTPAVDQDSKP